MLRRIECWIFMKLCNRLKPEISMWRVSGFQTLDEVDPGDVDCLTIHVDNGVHGLHYDTYRSNRARNMAEERGLR